MNYYQCPTCCITDEYDHEFRCLSCGTLVHVRSDDDDRLDDPTEHKNPVRKPAKAQKRRRKARS